jgi:hypothetical protein
MKIRISPDVESDLRTICEHIRSKEIFEQVVKVYFFSHPYKGVAHAHGCEISGGFLVLKGSLATSYENVKLRARHKKIRRELIANGVLQQKDDVLEFTKPYLFENEYEVTSVISGNNKCRTQEGVWTDAEGRTPLENRLEGLVELKTSSKKERREL